MQNRVIFEQDSGMTSTTAVYCRLRSLQVRLGELRTEHDLPPIAWASSLIGLPGSAKLPGSLGIFRRRGVYGGVCPAIYPAPAVPPDLIPFTCTRAVIPVPQ